MHACRAQSPPSVTAVAKESTHAGLKPTRRVQALNLLGVLRSPMRILEQHARMHVMPHHLALGMCMQAQPGARAGQAGRAPGERTPAEPPQVKPRTCIS